jgi:hypothetical protein
VNGIRDTDKGRRFRQLTRRLCQSLPLAPDESTDRQLRAAIEAFPREPDSVS